MEDERLVVSDLDELSEVFLRLFDVDEGVARVVEDAEEAVDAHVDAGRLQQRLVVGVDDDPPLLEQPPDRPVGKDHARILGTPYACAAFGGRGRSQRALPRAPPSAPTPDPDQARSGARSVARARSRDRARGA